MMSTRTAPSQKATPKPKAPQKGEKAVKTPPTSSVSESVEKLQPGDTPPQCSLSKEETYCTRVGINFERHPIAGFHDQLGHQAVANAAIVAAILMGSKNLSPDQAVRNAYELLELSAGGWLAITNPKIEGIPSYERGILLAQKDREKELKRSSDWKSVPTDFLSPSEDGKFLTAPFDQALMKRMPKGYSDARRVDLFTRWCTEFLEIPTERAATLIEEWEKSGMPPVRFLAKWLI